MPTKKITKKAVTKTAKKIVKKAVKKVAAKKISSKKVPKHVRALVCAVGEDCFWTTDGRVLEDLSQLEIAFGSMDDEVFLHHVTKEKNDFANWVESILEDSACAADLRRSKKPASAQTVVRRYIRLYTI